MESVSDQIGERLLNAREKAGLSVDDVVFQTRIPRSVVAALEAADFSVFSSPTYAKSFLSQYSEFLKVDARMWLDALEPVAFLPGDVVLPSWQVHPAQRDLIQATRSAPNGWLAAISALALSGALIYAAIKGYEFLELRFGGEAEPLKSTANERQEPPAPASEVIPKVEAPRTPPTPPPALEVVEPPPRARIVRDDGLPE